MFGLLFLAAELVDYPGAHVMDGQVGRSGHASSGECFENDRSLQSRKSCSAFAVNSCESHLRGLSESLDWEVLLLLPIDGVRTQLLLSEIEGLRPQGEQILAESLIFKFVDAVVDVRPIVDVEAGEGEERVRGRQAATKS